MKNYNYNWIIIGVTKHNEEKGKMTFSFLHVGHVVVSWYNLIGKTSLLSWEAPAPIRTAGGGKEVGRVKPTRR